MKNKFALIWLLSTVLISVYQDVLHCQRVTGYQHKTILKPLNSEDSVIMARECFNRRQYLSDKLERGVLVMNNNENTGKNFFYLTGWNGKPASCFVEFGSGPIFTLFIPESNPQSIIWNGEQPGKKEAETLGAHSFQYYEFKKHLKGLLKSDKKLYLLNQDNTTKEILKSLLHTRADSDRIVYIDSIVHEMRVIKSNYEVQNIKNAIAVTENALFNAYKVVQPGKYEYEIGALFSYEYTRNGIKEAFPCIVGSGKKATALHYEANNKLINEDDLLLMDVGAEYNGYAADITRTIPVNRKFSKMQLELYNLVLKAQEEGINVMRPGYKVLDFHQKCIQVLTGGLFKLGFITDTNKLWQKEIFILYQAGHYLGLDVHDVGRYSAGSSEYTRIKAGFRGRDLLPGMVITIEPGLYINPDMLKYIYNIYGQTVPKQELDAYVTKVAPVFEKYANIGIRIEDDILITTTGNEVLSKMIPKNPEEIERMMKK